LPEKPPIRIQNESDYCAPLNRGVFPRFLTWSPCASPAAAIFLRHSRERRSSLYRGLVRLGEGGKIDLVHQWARSTYSYAPAFDHYWFSSVPDEEVVLELLPHPVGAYRSRTRKRPAWRATIKKSLGPLLARLPIAVGVRFFRGAPQECGKGAGSTASPFADMQRSFAHFSPPSCQTEACVVEVGTGAGDFLKPFCESRVIAPRGFEPSPDSVARGAGRRAWRS